MPIPVDHPFQIVVALQPKEKIAVYVMVFQDPLPNGIWHSPPLITRLLVEQIVPLFGMPEALLPDRGTNLLSVLM